MPKVEKRSFVWKYFVKEGDTCKCTKCPYTHKPKSATTSAMAHHLRVVHKIAPDIEEVPVDVDSDVAVSRSGAGGSTSSSKAATDKQKVRIFKHT
jgi:hypothetical protein